MGEHDVPDVSLREWKQFTGWYDQCFWLTCEQQTDSKTGFCRVHWLRLPRRHQETVVEIHKMIFDDTGKDDQTLLELWKTVTKWMTDTIRSETEGRQ